MRRATRQEVALSSVGAPNSCSRRWTATSNCIGPTAASIGAWSPRSGSRSTCTTPSSSSWAMPRRNCLNRPVSFTRATWKCSGANSGSRGNSTGGVEVERVADGDVHGVDEAEHVARPRLLDRVALLAEHRVGVLGGERLAGGAVGDDHPALEPARAHPHERDAVAVARVHVRLHLEREGRERRVERPRHAATCRRAAAATAPGRPPRRAAGARRSW